MTRRIYGGKIYCKGDEKVFCVLKISYKYYTIYYSRIELSPLSNFDIKKNNTSNEVLLKVILYQDYIPYKGYILLLEVELVFYE